MNNTALANMVRNLADEIGGWLNAPSTVYRAEWQMIGRWITDGIDRIGTEHEWHRPELDQVRAAVRQLRGREGVAQFGAA